MSDLDATTPRVFLARHGETIWTITGRYTSFTELELTDNGIKQVVGTANQLIGPKKLIKPANIAQVFVSPRKRAQQTLQLLFPSQDLRSELAIASDKVTTTGDIDEWNLGDYEGLLTAEIRAKRSEKGLDKDSDWEIWKDGCENGESPEEVTERLDRLISKIQSIQEPYMHGEKPADVVIVAHGMILRAFLRRWLKLPLKTPLAAMISPGAIGILSYEKHNIQKPAFFMGMSLPMQE